MLKQDVLKMMQDLPDEVTADEVMYKIYLLEKHEKAMKDIECNRIFTTEEVRNSLLVNK